MIAGKIRFLFISFFLIQLSTNVFASSKLEELVSHEIIQGKATAQLPSTWVSLKEGVNDQSEAFKKLAKLKLQYFGVGTGDGNLDVKFDEMFLFEEGRASLSFFYDTATPLKASSFEEFKITADLALQLQFSIAEFIPEMKKEHSRSANDPKLRVFEDIETEGMNYRSLYLEFNNEEHGFLRAIIILSLYQDHLFYITLASNTKRVEKGFFEGVLRSIEFKPVAPIASLSPVAAVVNGSKPCCACALL